ncbi:MAG: hypothetical protein AAF657_28190 [Acidobacteriota bacterium]
MKIHRDVILDLWPVFRSGEASAATTSLIEKYLAEDPELAELLRQADQERGQDMSQASFAELTPDDEMQALNATRRVLRWQKILMGLGIFFCAVPFSMYGNSEEGLVWWMIRDQTGQAMVYLALGVVAWLAYFATGRRLGRKGF